MKCSFKEGFAFSCPIQRLSIDLVPIIMSEHTVVSYINQIFNQTYHLICRSSAERSVGRDGF